MKFTDTQRAAITELAKAFSEYTLLRRNLSADTNAKAARRLRLAQRRVGIALILNEILVRIEAAATLSDPLSTKARRARAFKTTPRGRAWAAKHPVKTRRTKSAARRNPGRPGPITGWRKWYLQRKKPARGPLKDE